MKKEWKYVYEDDIKVTEEEDLLIGGNTRHITAEHSDLLEGGIIVYDTPTRKCLLHTDKEIVGLKLIDTDKAIEPSTIRKEDVDVMPITPEEAVP